MIVTLLGQGAYYVPSLLAHLVGLGVAAFLFGRARVAALLLAGGTAFQLLASVCSYGVSAWSMFAYQEGGMAASDVGFVSAALGFVASLTRALGEVGVVAAVVAAALAYGQPPAAPAEAR